MGATSDINFYVADEGVHELPDRLRKAKVDQPGQASYSGNLPGTSTDQVTAYYYINADESSCCTRLWDPSGVKVFPSEVSTVIILWGIEGNDRDMQCEGFQP